MKVLSEPSSANSSHVAEPMLTLPPSGHDSQPNNGGAGQSFSLLSSVEQSAVVPKVEDGDESGTETGSESENSETEEEESGSVASGEQEVFTSGQQKSSPISPPAVTVSTLSF